MCNNIDLEFSLFIWEVQKAEEFHPEYEEQIREWLVQTNTYRDQGSNNPYEVYERNVKYNRWESQLRDALLNQSFYRTAEHITGCCEAVKGCIPSCVRDFVADGADAFVDRYPNGAFYLTLLPKVTGFLGYHLAKASHKIGERLWQATSNCTAKKAPEAAQQPDENPFDEDRWPLEKPQNHSPVDPLQNKPAEEEDEDPWKDEPSAAPLQPHTPKSTNPFLDSHSDDESW